MARFDQGGGKRFGGNTGGSRFGGKSFGRPSFGRKSFGDRGDREGDRRGFEMHDAICSECGKNCQIPFRPTGEKPVYCSECFGAKGDRREDRRERRSFGDRRLARNNFSGNDDLKRQIEGMNAKLDKLAEAIETLVLRWEK
ncbi:MAG TPA: hypothetical protein P5056_03690 [Candidatus Paceibacterota bacterium]|nr:hypothetical protein [Candidatus Paceibacterota bacterium]